MLKVGNLYQEQLKKLYCERWYDPHYQFWFGSNAHYYYNVPDNDEYRREFVSVDKDDKVIGHFSYRFDMDSRNANNFGMILFDKSKKIMFARDVLDAIEMLFTTFNCHSAIWNVIIGNPAEQIYDKFIEQFGGKVCSYYKDDAYLYGKYYDTKGYQLLQKDYLENHCRL